MDSSSIVALTGDNSGSPCGYCHSKDDTSFSTGLWAYHLHPRTYQMLIDGGWRRSGKYLYKPDIARSCCPAYTIRLDSTAFLLSQGNKKALKKIKKLLSRPVAASAEAPEESTPMDTDAEGSGDASVRDAGLGGLEKHARPLLEESSLTPQLNKKQKSTAGDLASVGPHAAATLAPEIASPKKEKAPWQKSPKHRKNAPQNDVLESILDIEALQTADGNKLEVKIVRSTFEEDTFELYSRYQMLVHNDPPEKIKRSGFTNFLVDSPLTFISPEEILHQSPSSTKTLGDFPGYGSFHQKYYLNGTLIAVSVVDILPSCVSAVYFMYDPASPLVKSLSMGVYSGLRECALAKQFSHVLPDLKFYYMGFYIHSCSKMRYKAQFRPSELTCPKMHVWVPVELCTKLLDINKVARLSAGLTLEKDSAPDSSDTSIFGPVSIARNFLVDGKDLGNIMVYQEGGVVLLRMLPQGVAQKFARELAQFGQLVGMDIVKELLFVLN
ncbi:Arginyl-tRNA--protein transferase 1 [Podochytrium sp. JEL0797]|nr:Arginyl-tRNA--protein transferase 1 [Podochytrium sp. JEL0797]